MRQPTTLQQLVNFAREQCQRHNIEHAEFSIFVLLEHYTGKTKLDYLTKAEQIIEASKIEQFTSSLAKLTFSMPLYRIVGERDFFGLKLTLNEHTLEPRFDTEIIVELAIKHIDKLLNNNCSVHFLDMGTGSGAISLALLHHYREQNVFATAIDISKKCLEAVFINSEKYNLKRKLRLVESDLFNNIHNEKFDILISNPPYIASADINKLDPMVKNYDPKIALDGGPDGLKFYRLIASQAMNYLSPNGLIILEIGYDQQQKVINLFKAYQFIEAKQDYNKLDRALVFAMAR